MTSARIEHETRCRLRVTADPSRDVHALRRHCAGLEGVRAVRANARLHCLVVEHDGRAATRSRVLGLLGANEPQPPQPGPGRSRATSLGWDWIPALGALGVLAVPRDWKRAAAMATVGARVLAQPARLRQDPAAVVLDAASLAALAAAGQGVVVAASVLLRLGAERMSARLVRQVDGLLSQVLPQEAAQYRAADAGGGMGEVWLALPELRPGDRLRIEAGDVVPVDGWVLQGSATVAAAARGTEGHAVGAGEALPAGTRLLQGQLVLQATREVASSRLARMRDQLRHALQDRDPPGPLQPAAGRLLSLPLTAAALVLGLTGDTARAGAMLQADPRQGLDLALPVAREAALYALARHGLLTAGLAAMERLAEARTLVLQDTTILAAGRWAVQAIETLDPAVDEPQVRRWIAGLADTPGAGALRSLPDAVVREWVRYGAVLAEHGQEIHLASPRRLRSVWGLEMPPHRARRAGGDLARDVAVVSRGRLLATVRLTSPLRTGAAARVRRLARLGFGRIALFTEDDGRDAASPASGAWADALALERVAPAGRREWLSSATAPGRPLVFVHTDLRDLVPPGSLSLTPMDAEAGAHGLLLDDPLESLLRARLAARTVHRRLELQRAAATTLNAALMMASALRWVPPMATTLLHHGFAVVLLLDSLRIESLSPPADPGEGSDSHWRTEP